MPLELQRCTPYLPSLELALAPALSLGLAQVPGLHTVSALACNGADQLAVGSVTGSLDAYRLCAAAHSYRQRYTLQYRFDGTVLVTDVKLGEPPPGAGWQRELFNAHKLR